MSAILRYLLDVSREDLPASWTDAGVMVKLSEAIGGAGFDVRLLTPRDEALDPVEVRIPPPYGLMFQAGSDIRAGAAVTVDPLTGKLVPAGTFEKNEQGTYPRAGSTSDPSSPLRVVPEIPPPARVVTAATSTFLAALVDELVKIATPVPRNEVETFADRYAEHHRAIGAACTVAAFLAGELGRDDLKSRALSAIGVKP